MKVLNFSSSDSTFEALKAAYSEKHRYYHNVQHIDACLKQLAPIVGHLAYPDEVELALWFHDAIYKIRSRTNEKDSALWAQRFCLEAGGSEGQAERVKALILATQHPARPTEPDAQWLVDIDLGILGQSTETYQRFETQIRQEYRWVPGPLFRRKRAELLEAFLEQDCIYLTPYFQAKYEVQARQNLTQAIQALKA